MLALTERVILTALGDWEDFAAYGVSMKLAVNVPVSALVKLPIPQMLREARPRAANWPGLILEVTEDQIIHDLELANDVADALRELQMHLALDDFGAGYSSLGGCSSCRSASSRSTAAMSTNCHADQVNAGLCETIVELGQRFGLKTVARASRRRTRATSCRRSAATSGRAICSPSRCRRPSSSAMLRARMNGRAVRPCRSRASALPC